MSRKADVSYNNHCNYQCDVVSVCLLVVCGGFVDNV